jgi:hypothetical protein
VGFRTIKSSYYYITDFFLLSQLGPEFDVNSTWPTLSRNIREIQRNNAHNLSFEENHRFGYNMVLYKHGDVLYRGLRELVVEHLDELAEEWIVPAFPVDRVQQTGEGEVLLKALRRVWDDHIGSMTKIGQILKYMVSGLLRNMILPSFPLLMIFLIILFHIYLSFRIAFMSKKLKSSRLGIWDLSFSYNVSFDLLFRITW